MKPPLSFDPIAAAQRNWEGQGWTAEAAPMAAFTAIMRAQQILLHRCEAVVKPFGLTFARYELLALLWFSRTGSLPMVKVSALLQVHPTSVTNAVDRLERAGFVERSPHPTDGRTTLVSLTDQGRDVAAQSTAQLNSVVFSDPGMSTPDINELIEILGRFRRDAGDFDEETAPDT